MKGRRNVFLVGMMGAGKTTIGRQLARVLRLPFEDTDQVIETQTCVSIKFIFEQEGEEAFRIREKAVISELTARKGLVLATGGGAVLSPENCENLRSRGCVVYLRAPVEVLIARTARDRNRPLLQGVDLSVQLPQLLEIRNPLYSKIADLIMDTGDRSIRSVVRDLVRRLSQQDLVRNMSIPAPWERWR